MNDVNGTSGATAARFDPNSAADWSTLSAAMLSQGRYEEATHCFGKALELNPLAVSARIGKGKSLAELDRYVESIQCYDKFVELDPKNANVWNDKWNSFDHKEHYGDAPRCWLSGKTRPTFPNLREAIYAAGYARKLASVARTLVSCSGHQARGEVSDHCNTPTRGLTDCELLHRAGW